MDITVTLTDTEYKSLEYVANTPENWAENALKERARLAKEEIIAILVKHCNENNVQIETGEDAQVTQAFTLGLVQKASANQATPLE